MSGPRHFPFRDGHDPRRMGVATIPLRDWFELGDDYAAQMAEKERLLAERRDAVFATMPGSEAASAAVLEAVCAWVLDPPGRSFRREGSQILCPDGRRVDCASRHPLEAAALLVQEDLCLMMPGAAGVPELVAACLCFPSRWVLAEKLGRPMSAIHDPVPGLNARLGPTIDRFLLGLKRGQIYARSNWSLATDPALFQPVALPHPPITAAEAGERLYYRVERQSLRRLDGASGVVVFGIRIHQHPLSALDAPMRAAFAEALAALDPALVEYKSMQAVRAAAIAYLRAARD